MKYKNKNQIRKNFKNADLLTIWPYFEKTIKPSIELDFELVDDKVIKIGKSKVGGNPDFPNNLEWPMFKDRPQSFIAQINLTDINKFDKEKLLPTKGILYFFYDCVQQEENGKGGSILYYPENKDLFRIEEPENTALIKYYDYNPTLIYKSAIISFSKGLTLPYYDHILFKKIKKEYLRFSDDYEEDNFQLLYYDEILDGGNFNSRIFGFSENVQNEMESTCFIIDKGLEPYTELSERDNEEFNNSWEDWILLLQIDTQKNLDLFFGHNGTLYYWIHKNDLKELKFDKVKVIMQT